MATVIDTIVLEDDDDDVRVLTPHSSTQGTYSHPFHIPVLDDDDLELRLGPSGNVPLGSVLGSLGRRTGQEPAVRLQLSSFQSSFFFSPAIDLTSANDKLEGYPRAAGKRKHCSISSEASCDVKLTCAICMDTMEEETSTICGHVFCRKCIVEAIKMQRKCPTCRRRLVNSQIHRIYLS